MNPAYVHLVWKEYRAIRAFWLALVVLSLGLQFLVSLVFSDARMMVFNIALATPVFFAVGCIGTAFAIEKEDGSYDWLRASPATDLQVFIGKVGLCIVATLAMFAVLWPIALWIVGRQIPAPEVFHGMLALWLLAAVEAIAWGTLFSLRFERPLPAILLALVVTSTIVHLAAMPFATINFNFDRFLSAVPFRLVVIAPVLFYDVYLGLRWLQGEKTRQSPRKRPIAPAKSRTPTKAETRLAVAAHLHTRDRGLLISHLVWQHLRQSWRLMALMVGLQIILTLLVRNLGVDPENLYTLVPLVGFAAMMGSSVFLPDQERRHYRFFAEHNVPPRYVWLTRLVPWIVVASISGGLTVLIWIGSRVLRKLFMMLLTGLGSVISSNHPGRVYIDDYFDIPPVLVGVAGAALAFAAGQWFSMHVRSGLLAGFFSLLWAALMTIWVWAVFTAGLSWLVFLVPIFFVLLWATWLRAPDWTLENSSWRARTKAGMAVLAPTLALLIAAPFVRTNQYPVTALNFSPGAFVAEITPWGLENGQLYRRANELLVNRWAPIQEELVDGVKVPSYMSLAEYLAANDESLQLALKATTRDPTFLANPQTLNHWPVVDQWALVSLATASGRELEARGNLDEAFDRYFATFTMQREWTNHAPNMMEQVDEPLRGTFIRLTRWSAKSGQTDARIRAAIARLQGLGDVLNGEDGIKSNFILCQRFLEFDQRVFSMFSIGEGSHLTARLMPWERIREQRELALTANNWLQVLNHTRNRMRAGEDVWHAADRHRNFMYSSPLGIASRLSRWSNTAVFDMIAFEARNRATQIVLACQAYRLRHGQLPKTLDDLIADPTLDLSILVGVPVGGTLRLQQLPNDPYTGRPFIYFPDGLPKPLIPGSAEDFEHRGDWQSNQMKFGLPCLWSPGPNLQTHIQESTIDQQSAIQRPSAEVYYTHRDQAYGYVEYFQRPLATNEALARGQWFPIPFSDDKSKPSEISSEPQSISENEP